MVSVRFKRILVPTDFTVFSRRAGEVAGALAKKFGAELNLFHVIEPFTYSVSDTLQVADHYKALKTVAEPLLEEERKKLSKSGLRVRASLARGVPYREILKKARGIRADLIVLGTHGRTGVSHLLLGSVAERVVRTFPGPVLTVRGGGRR